MSSTDYPLDEIARAWLVKMRGEDAPRLQSEFETWLAAAPEHRKSYDRIAHAMDRSAILKSSRRHGLARSSAVSSTRRRWLPAGAITAAAALLVAVGTSLLLPTGSKDSLIAARATEPLVTRRGEIKIFRFADGATATLDTDSRLELVEAGDALHLRLTRGRARLDFARGAGPFRVDVGNATVSGDNAGFDIGVADGGAVDIMVLRGRAEMTSRMVGGGARALPPGEPLRYRMADGELRRERAPTISPPSADWPTGWSEHRSIQLTALAREANRYAARPIVIDDAATGRLEVSGRFQVSRPEIMADRLGALFDLAVERRADGIHLRPR
jgi:transmembrane sensor